MVRTVLSRRSEQHGPEESLCGRRVKRGCRRRGRGRHARMTRNGRVCARPSESSGEGCVAGLPGLAACECGSAAGRAPARSRGSAPALSPPCEADAAQRTPRPGGLDLPCRRRRRGEGLAAGGLWCAHVRGRGANRGWGRGVPATPGPGAPRWRAGEAPPRPHVTFSCCLLPVVVTAKKVSPRHGAVTVEMVKHVPVVSGASGLTCTYGKESG